MKSPKLTLTINEAAKMLREAGIPMTAITLADGIEDGAYPFGRLVRTSDSGRRMYEIFIVDVQRFIESKIPKEVTTSV